MVLTLAGCGVGKITDYPESETIEQNKNNDSVTAGTEEYEGFLLDNVLHSKTEGDIHYNVYIPDSYDGTEPYALYFTLPGYQGLYFRE